ncbi:hypothetical protein P4646_05265 [Peribacillus simplex]|uniref:hypothetical protein n=1 Tax=Peribacillus simplex TaxID=1478 RepID=UPI002E2310F3|nr:hypothetical protein [Peribacillus simplex]MED4096995.1 hypothetical protein [Peribacillus simplex]
MINEGVSEIILVAIGSFKKPYYIEDYTILGNVYEPGYTYQLERKRRIQGIVNEKSSEIINQIHNIIKS